MPLPNADNVDPDVPANLLQLRQQEADEVRELIKGRDTATNTKDYIKDEVIEDIVTTSQLPTAFLVGPVEDDNEYPDAGSDLSSRNSNWRYRFNRTSGPR